MPDFDLSLVVTVHNETLVSGPTMRAAEMSITYAEQNGFNIERIIAFDAATDECIQYFSQSAFDHWKKVQLSEGDLGRARNVIGRKISSNWIAFLDADDLFSENWLAEGCAILREAEDEGLKVIVHPELNWLFDADKSIFVKPDQDDKLFLPHYFAMYNYYDSLCIAPVEAQLKIPYIHRDIKNGFSFQDWQWSIETMDAGWKHVVARDTIIFKRRRDSSLVTESSNRKAILRSLEPLAIDKILSLGKSRLS